MKNKIIPIALFFSLLFFTKCSTDFNMYADYKDITVVYSIANIDSDTTWVKITKAFTGPGNALLIAKNPDSSNYSYKLDATLTGKKNGTNLTPITLDTLTIHNKAIADTVISENGDTTLLNPFYAPNQLVYYAVGSLDKDAEYTLTVNKKNQKITATTSLVNNFTVSKPINRISFSNSSQSPDGKIEWSSAKNGKRYEVSLRFNYLELLPGKPDTLHKSIDWFLGVVSSKTSDGGENLEETYSGPAFYNLLQNKLEAISNVERWVDNVDMTIACGSQVLATYLNINTGSGSLLEEVPDYTNIIDGVGLFASRYTNVKSIPLSVITERTLVQDYDLGFKYKTK